MSDPDLIGSRIDTVLYQAFPSKERVEGSSLSFWLSSEPLSTSSKLIGVLGHAVSLEFLFPLEEKTQVFISTCERVGTKTRFSLAICPDPSYNLEVLDRWAQREHLEVGLDLGEVLPQFSLTQMPLEKNGVPLQHTCNLGAHGLTVCSQSFNLSGTQILRAEFPEFAQFSWVI